MNTLIRIILGIFRNSIVFRSSQKIRKTMQGTDSDITICSQSDENYIIKKPSLSSQFFMGSFLNLAVVIVLFLIECFLSPVTSAREKLTFTIMVIVFLVIGVLAAIAGVHWTKWEVRMNGNKIEHITIFRKKQYTFSDVTRAVSNHDDKLRVYSGKRHLFTLPSSSSYYFEVTLKKYGVPIEDSKKMTVDVHVVQPYGILKWGAMAGLLFFSWVMISAIKEGLFIFTISFLINILILCGVLKFFLEKTEIQHDTITHRAFLKKTQVIKINEISCLREESKGSVPFITVYSGKNKVMKIRKHSDGIALFEAKMEKEKKRWYGSTDE